MSSIFNNFFGRKNNAEKESKITYYNDEKFIRSKSGRYKSATKKRNRITDDTFSPAHFNGKPPNYSSSTDNNVNKTNA